MTIIKCLLTIVLMLLINQDDKKVNSEVVEQALRSLTDIVPTHYDLQFIPWIIEGYFVGSVNIKLNVRKPTRWIALHMSQLTINESETKLIAKVYNPEKFIKYKLYLLTNYKKFVEYTILPKSHRYDTENQLMIIEYKDYLQSTNVDYVLHLKFRGLMEETCAICKISYTNNEGNKTFVAATNFQSTNARKAFPCWDKPNIKATFKLSIKHYPNYTALSNMPSRRSKAIDSIDEKLWTYFETTPIMSTNILGFVIADYDYISNKNGTIKIWGSTHLVHNATYYLDVAENATRELEKFTNSTMSVPKMDHVAVSNYSNHSSASWGMIVYKESLLLKGRIYDTVITIVHELAHQWFGNLVSPASWDYLWLNEGTSTYLSYYIANAIFKEWRLMELFVMKEKQFMLFLDSICYKPLTDLCASITRNVTRTGALLRMVSHFVREDVFRNGLIKYLQTHKYSSATLDNLWKALQDALDESDIRHDDFNVKEVMDTWINQPAYPVVKINREYDTDEIKITQHKRVNFWNITETEENYAWWIPINFMTKRNLNSSSTLATHWLNPHNKSLTIKGVNRFDWIIVNKQMTGYYRVNYDEINWRRIAEFLISDDYDKIPTLNRAQIIIDVQYMMETEELDFNIFLEVISYLWHEIDPVPWYRALSMIGSLASSYLPIPDAAVIFKPYFYNLTYKLFDHIGFDDNYFDDPMTIEVRSQLIKFACLYDIHPECSRKGTAKLLAYVEDLVANKVKVPVVERLRISSEKNFLLCGGLMRANETLWAQFLHTKGTKATAEFLGCSENLEIIKNHLMLLKAHHRSVYLFGNMYTNLPLNVDATDIIINKYEEIDAGICDTSSLYATHLHQIILNHFKEEDISKIETSIEHRRFFLNNEYINERRRIIRKLNENLSKVQTAIKDYSYLYVRNFINKTHSLIVNGTAYE